ncbi:thiol-disulfide oxidoreductase ResA [Sporosarcina thermotolerans]|uniref:Thiol-disulfide oxidoreductase ResA n=1 Tax=Sporosarcina thermotolerans TaxID=633404 RepID=A0AAW9A8U9_9BACL|nr:thiol-disulfide oxidoreductase ResA [Sporosarcina thermotolerans]MDW0115601.1 thiol-disulfide oxidoreductase ResA [Sporosarcina thermotolerans]WHT47100.1 thiol-disulfide oxidoreductase ResA [Sporosarcina thermotolerans]
MSKANKKQSRLIFRSVVLLLLAAAIIFSIVSKDKVKVLAVGDKAPDFELVDLDGNKQRLSDYKGEGVFLNFWGTWCPPCKREMPDMEEQYNAFKEKGVHVLSVNSGESNLKVDTFRDQYGLTFPIVIDKAKDIRDLYNIQPLPTTFLIDKDGRIKKIIITEMTRDEIISYMESIQP